MGKLVKVGIIGQGRSGYGIHAQTIKKLPDKFKIAAVSDMDEAYRQRAVSEFGCDAYADYKSLLERKDLDLIVNASPSHLHVPLTEEFLLQGFNVLVEKPLARTSAEVDRLIAAAEKTGAKLTIFQQSRFSPAFQKIMEVIRSGRLGRIVQARVAFNSFQRRWDWQTLQANNGGNLLNTGPHPLDQCLQILGSDTMPQVFCHMDRVNTFGDAEDYVKVILKKEGHPLIDLEISSCDALPLGMYHVQGQYGTIKGDTSKLTIKTYNPATAPKQQLIREPLKNPDGSPAYCRETLEWSEEVWTAPESEHFAGMADAYYTRLYNTLVNGVPMEVTAEQVKLQIAVIEECHRQNPLSRLDD